MPAGTADEAAQAVMAARAAFPAWAALPLETRAAYLDKVSAGLKARMDELATTIAREVGMPLKLARAVQVGGPVWNWANFAEVARAFEWERKVGNSLVVRESIGVVGCITPWNFPLNQITLKVAPALVAGCTVVLKPSEIAPINAMILAEIIHEAGLPPGVFNLVNGAGPVVGEVLRWRIFDGALNTNILIDFLRRLIKGASKKMFLILDNLRVHHAKQVKAWLAEHADAIEVFYLPSYSPELNPDEMANADIKQAVTTLAPARTKLQLVKATARHLRSVQRQPERIRKYFEHGPVRYAA